MFMIIFMLNQKCKHKQGARQNKATQKFIGRN